ncbi:MAG: Long-chain-fatty-acid--CoA ligase [Promethearchaeota archaeon]|nr:MAG: Long-chain-fatty-acid--CoA ligase [Candidatus Lokiarchaeota archaeon]
MTYFENKHEISQDFSWVGNWSRRRAVLTPEREAIYDHVNDRRYTFKEIDQRANKAARLLENSGIEKGDRVGVFCSNRIECIDLFFATAKIGAILVPFNIRLAPQEINALNEKMRPSILFYEPKFLDKIADMKSAEFIKRHITFDKKNDLDDEYYTTLVGEQSGNDIDRSNINFEDPHLILFTGGTTGLPKGATLSHRLVFWNSVNTITSWGLHPTDVQPLLFPLFHTGGWNVLLMPFFHLGARSILMGDFDPDVTLKVIEQERCTIVIGVPTMFNMMTNSPNFEKTSFESVRVFISGGAPCPVAIMEKYWNRGKPFKMGYGLTEVGPNNFYLPIDRIKEKPTSVGLPVFHCDTKLVDPDTNETVEQGEVGELLLKGPHIFSGYWDEPEETKKTIEDNGWVHTGDLVKVDEEGFHYIVGRKKEMYISGGENVFPVEIEEVLYKHPAVDEAAVIGVPDEKWGEVGKAFVSFKKGKSASEEELTEYLKDKIAKYKIPKYIEIRNELPKSGTGKILKKELKKKEKSS